VGPKWFRSAIESKNSGASKPRNSHLTPRTGVGTRKSREGELVYDPFCGSGSTLLAAHQLQRIAYGVEIDPGYVAVTLERMAALGLKPELIDAAS